VTADHGKAVKRGGLFGHAADSAEAGEAPAQGCKGRDRLDELPPPRFGREKRTVGEARLRDCGDQRRVVHRGCDKRTSRVRRQAQFRLRAGFREKIELLFGHVAMMRGPVGQSNCFGGYQHQRQ
jgi:hypothetical protein